MPQWFYNFQQKLLTAYSASEMRRSYLVIGALVAVGAIMNWLIPHGWTVWPFIAAIGALLMINEAADRNGQGIPPMHVYALFGVALVGWLFIVAFLSALNPLVDILGIAGLVYYGIRGYIFQRQRDELIAFRRNSRLCIHCGEPADPEAFFCLNCGNEPNPDIATLRRVAAIARTPQQIARARGNLTGGIARADAASKEKALLSKRARPGQAARSNRAK